MFVMSFTLTSLSDTSALYHTLMFFSPQIYIIITLIHNYVAIFFDFFLFTLHANPPLYHLHPRNHEQ